MPKAGDAHMKVERREFRCFGCLGVLVLGVWVFRWVRFYLGQFLLRPVLFRSSAT